ncbi:hypothetical protein KC19_2G006100 [Ceratodon purpureus]|uniref:Uncharacterized protein n=1 Tax=Ceratodon purpureus TaxID=3225 RepID=A0A8T0IRB5_CERPU|nr:hypothetical protein KC19_2G006100 [Ceratodon purpureus]
MVYCSSFGSSISSLCLHSLLGSLFISRSLSLSLFCSTFLVRFTAHHIFPSVSIGCLQNLAAPFFSHSASSLSNFQNILQFPTRATTYLFLALALAVLLLYEKTAKAHCCALPVAVPS